VLAVLGRTPASPRLRPFVAAGERLLWKLLGAAGIGTSAVQFLDSASELDGSAGVTVLLLGDAIRETGLVGGIDAWRGYVVLPSELPQWVSVKRTVEVARKSGRACRCRQPVTAVALPSDPAAPTATVAAGGWGGGVGPAGTPTPQRQRRQRWLADAACGVCGGTGWAARAGDMRLVRQTIEVAPELARAGVSAILPVLHPAAVVRSGYALAPVLAADLRRAGRALRGELRLGTVAFDEFVTYFAGTGPLAADIETDGGGEIVRVGVADELRVWSVAWNQQNAQSVRAHLASGREIVLHNAAFDEPRLRAAGAPITGPLFDTMLATYQVQPDGKKGLNWAISLFLDAQRHKHRAEQEPARYNALDVRRTFDLREPLVRELVRTGQRAWFESTMMPALPVLIGMTERGLRIDQAGLPRWMHESTMREAAARARFHEVHPGVNPQSPAQLTRALGVDATDVDTLVDWIARGMDTAGAATALLEMRAAVAARKLPERFIGADGCVHPSYLPGAKDDDAGNKGIAYSGRPTARDPNVQQLPPSVRTLVVPHAPGRVLVAADWNQIELRLTAALAGDQVMQADLASDIHAQAATAIGCTRKVAKTGIYLSAYLGTPRLLHRKMRTHGITITFAECQTFQQRLFARYLAWEAWRRAVIASVERERELRNVFGKWAPFPRGRQDASRAVNFHPQSGAACILWRTLRPLAVALAPLDAWIVTVVHDEVLVDAPAGAVRTVAVVMRQVMEAEWPEVAPGFRVPVVIKQGPNWNKDSMTEVTP